MRSGKQSRDYPRIKLPVQMVSQAVSTKCVGIWLRKISWLQYQRFGAENSEILNSSTLRISHSCRRRMGLKKFRISDQFTLYAALQNSSQKSLQTDWQVGFLIGCLTTRVLSLKEGLSKTIYASATNCKVFTQKLPGLLLKLDISKAFDSVTWAFC